MPYEMGCKTLDHIKQEIMLFGGVTKVTQFGLERLQFPAVGTHDPAPKVRAHPLARWRRKGGVTLGFPGAAVPTSVAWACCFF